MINEKESGGGERGREREIEREEKKRKTGSVRGREIETGSEKKSVCLL